MTVSGICGSAYHIRTDDCLYMSLSSYVFNVVGGRIEQPVVLCHVFGCRLAACQLHIKVVANRSMSLFLAFVNPHSLSFPSLHPRPLRPFALQRAPPRSFLSPLCSISIVATALEKVFIGISKRFPIVELPNDSFNHRKGIEKSYQ